MLFVDVGCCEYNGLVGVCGSLRQGLVFAHSPLCASFNYSLCTFYKMCTFCFPLHLGFCMVTRGGMFHVKQGVFGKSDSFFCKASGLGAGWCSLCLCHTQFLRPLAWWIGDLPLTLPCVRFFPLAWCGLQNTMRSLLACATPSSLLAPPLALAC